jgi:uncharacterized protein
VERVWVDVTNSPEVLFFRPILRRMDDAGVPTIVTARDFAQTLGLLELYGIPHTAVGRHGGGSLRGKAVNLVRRSFAMTRFGRGKGIRQSVSIGSNDLAVASRLLRIHNTIIQDYEGAEFEHKVNFRLANKVMFPEVVPFEALQRLGLDRRRYRPYAGLKEQVTLADFEPDLSVPDQLGLESERTIAVMRPPATMSLYNRGIENRLFDDVVHHLVAANVQVVMLPRDADQATLYRARTGVLVPDKPVDGPSLLYAADVVISAGGSMNREAAVLGVPTWTTFAGKLGAVDRMLVEEGKMKVIHSPEELVVTKRQPSLPHFESLADAVTEEILRR